MCIVYNVCRGHDRLFFLDMNNTILIIARCFHLVFDSIGNSYTTVFREVNIFFHKNTRLCTVYAAYVD